MKIKSVHSAISYKNHKWQWKKKNKHARVELGKSSD